MHRDGSKRLPNGGLFLFLEESWQKVDKGLQKKATRDILEGRGEKVMKKGKFAIFGLVALLIAGCAPFGRNSEGYEVIAEPLDEAWVFVAGHEYFIPDPKFQSPRQFEEAGGGVCMGFAIDLVYHLGPEASYVVCEVSWGEPGKTHAIVKYHGEYLEPQAAGYYYTLGDEYLVSIVKEIPYDDIMSASTDYGSRVLGTSDAWILEPFPLKNL